MKIEFDFTHSVYGKYRDALYLPDDHLFTEEEIDSMKRKRFDNWVAYIEAASNNSSIEEQDSQE
jgi:hypothetical protein